MKNNVVVATLGQLVVDARKRGVKPRKDDKGREYMTLVYDKATGVMFIETTTDEDMKRAKAISPRSGK